MTGFFDNLPDDHDVSAAGFAVRLIVETLNGCGETYEDIARRASQLHPEGEIRATAVRAFVGRRGEKRFNRSSRTLAALFDFIRTDLETFPKPVRAVVDEHWSVLRTSRPVPKSQDAEQALETPIGGETTRQLGAQLRDWMEISTHSMNRLSERLCGDYVLLRKSIHSPNLIVKSVARVERLNHSLLVMTHVHRDRQNVSRVSRGFVYPVARNIYCVLKIESGEGLEIMAFNEPIQAHFQKLRGFTTSIDMDRNILCARSVMERSNETLEKLGWRTPLDRLPADTPEALYLAERVNLLDVGTASALSEIMFSAVMAPPISDEPRK
jgi:hypothetical protein